MDEELCLPSDVRKAVDDELGRHGKDADARKRIMVRLRMAIDDELYRQGLNEDARKRVMDCLAGPRPTAEAGPPAGGTPPEASPGAGCCTHTPGP